MANICLGYSVNAQEKMMITTEMLTRHGIISGATGTGKTITLQILAEEFSKLGIPVFTADAKGDLAGISQKGIENAKITERIKTIGLDDFEYSATPTIFWDVYGKNGHPIRTTVSEMGPILLSRLLNLSKVQDAVLHMAFTIADAEGLLLLDLKDVKAVLSFLAENKKKLSVQYGNITDVTIASLQRQILILENAGGNLFFGEKAFDLQNLLQKDFSGKGVVSVLDAQKLVQDNRLYSTFLLWLLSELFEDLPEIGDQEMPKLVFFFDEAHLLFSDAPEILIEKIEQVVRLVRSKGVGIYFVTQNPLDIPEKIRGQLGNRVQHALRAFTPKEQKAVIDVSETFRPNGDLPIKDLIGSVKVGYALVSFLNEHGEPTATNHVMIRPPQGRIGAISPEERIQKIQQSPFFGKYEEIIDRESAFELLAKRKNEISAENNTDGIMGSLWKTVTGNGGKQQSMAETFAKQVIRSVGSRLATQLVRGILGSLKK